MQKGDLVVIIKNCKCEKYYQDIGLHFILPEIQEIGLYCRSCGLYWGIDKCVLHPDLNDTYIPLWALKRIPPLPELEKETIADEALA